MPQDDNFTFPRGNALICLGSNATSRAGGPVETLRAAIASMETGPFEIVSRSRFFVSPFFPSGAEPDVVNAVVLAETSLSPEGTLAALHGIEAEFDRTRDARWTSRTLDLDILTMNDKILPDQLTVQHWIDLAANDQRRLAPDQLILPHPRIQDRAFVLVPAADVAPDWWHPILGQTITQMRDALSQEDVRSVTPIGD